MISIETCRWVPIRCNNDTPISKILFYIHFYTRVTKIPEPLWYFFRSFPKILVSPLPKHTYTQTRKQVHVSAQTRTHAGAHARTHAWHRRYTQTQLRAPVHKCYILAHKTRKKGYTSAQVYTRACTRTTSRTHDCSHKHANISDPPRLNSILMRLPPLVDTMWVRMFVGVCACTI